MIIRKKTEHMSLCRRIARQTKTGNTAHILKKAHKDHTCNKIALFS